MQIDRNFSLTQLQRILSQKNATRRSRRSRLFAENHVFLYAWYRYKFPNYPELFLGKHEDYVSVLHDQMQLICCYLRSVCMIAQTTLVPYQSSYFIKQAPVKWSIITRHMVKNNPQLHRILVDFLIQNKRMRTEQWIFVDMMWTDAIVQPWKLHNLIWNGSEICIFDFGVLDRRSPNFFFRWLSWLFYNVQTLIIKRWYLG